MDAHIDLIHQSVPRFRQRFKNDISSTLCSRVDQRWCSSRDSRRDPLLTVKLTVASALWPLSSTISVQRCSPSRAWRSTLRRCVGGLVTIDHPEARALFDLLRSAGALTGSDSRHLRQRSTRLVGGGSVTTLLQPVRVHLGVPLIREMPEGLGSHAAVAQQDLV